MKTRVFLYLLSVFSLLTGNPVFSQDESFNYKRFITDDLSTLFLNVNSVDRLSGDVIINGVDTRGPSIPFTWIWGDGNINQGWFPQTHRYVDKDKNYVVKVISHYSTGSTDSCETLVDFVNFSINQIPLDPNLKVIIPSQNISLGTHLYAPPTNLTFYTDDLFTKFSRSDIEYLLSAGASIDYDLVNNDVFLYNNKFEQYMFRDAAFGGAYSLWFTDPVSFGVGDVFMTGDIDFQSLFHEMGHNFTLNTPSDFYFGGKIDGNANAVYSESMAQIFSHSAGYILLNNYMYYGLDAALTFKLKLLFNNSCKFLRNCYDNYNTEKKFYSWNNPSTQMDETFLTFMTIAYKFIEHAENNGKGYKVPVKNMMRFLQEFNSNYFTSWDQQNNTLKADTFRATYMIAALSNAFQEDLKNEFQLLNFPVSNELFDQIIKDSGIQFLAVSTNALSVAGDAGSTATFKITSNTDWNITSDQTWLTLSNASGSDIASITVTAAANPATATRTATVTVMAEGMGSRVITVIQDVKTTGSVIYLQSGWNIISFNVIPLNSDMKAIFQPLIDNNSLLKVQDETGNSLEDYGIFGGWINNIGNMALTEAYKVKVSKNCQLSIEGIPATFPFDIPLKGGWNIFGYPLTNELDGKVVVKQLIDRGTLIKVQDETGNAIEDYGIFGGWTNNIGNFKPGEGYKIKVTNNETLILLSEPNAYWQPGDPWIDPRDNNNYGTVQIGTQIWMRENMAYLPAVYPPAVGSVTAPCYYVYAFNGTDISAAKATENYITYGVLYNWTAAMDGAESSSANPSGVRGVCPVGWHLPSDAEWSALSNYLINNGYGYEGSGTDIAKSLATKTIWSESTIPGTPGKDPAGNNSSGFSGLPGGARHISAIFSGIGGYAYWWSSQRNNASDAWDRDMHYHGTGLSRGYFSKDYGFNVRCVRD